MTFDEWWRKQPFTDAPGRRAVAMNAITKEAANQIWNEAISSITQETVEDFEKWWKDFDSIDNWSVGKQDVKVIWEAARKSQPQPTGAIAEIQTLLQELKDKGLPCRVTVLANSIAWEREGSKTGEAGIHTAGQLVAQLKKAMTPTVEEDIEAIDKCLLGNTRKAWERIKGKIKRE